MKVRAVSLIEPQIHLVNAGLLSRLFRPAGMQFDGMKPGDLLWVREPFALHVRFDFVSPSLAAALGAVPMFTGGGVAGYIGQGRRRAARELPRIWHRQHLRITALEQRRARDIPPEDIRAQGFPLIEGFTEAWARNQSLARRRQAWAENPLVTVIDFERIAAPLSTESEYSA